MRKPTRDLVLALGLLCMLLACVSVGVLFRRNQWLQTHVTRNEALAFADRFEQVTNSKETTPEDVLSLVHDDAALIGDGRYAWPVERQWYAESRAGNDGGAMGSKPLRRKISGTYPHPQNLAYNAPTFPQCGGVIRYR